MKGKKPNKRQKAILNLLSLIETEGLHYGLVHHGGQKTADAIEDEDLSDLISAFRLISRHLERKVGELEEEVKGFLPDDSDF